MEAEQLGKLSEIDTQEVSFDVLAALAEVAMGLPSPKNF